MDLIPEIKNHMTTLIADLRENINTISTLSGQKHCSGNRGGAKGVYGKEAQTIMGRKILTADDSASMRQMVTYTLNEAGYDVIESVDGKDALSKLSPDVGMIITDLNMPDMDGIELVRAVRDKPEFKFIPIILLTTESQDLKKKEGRDAGATGWIVKPFKPDQLVGVVRKVFK